MQDYFTKWGETIPLPGQTAARITGELIKLFSIYGYPDQGCNFESSILAETLRAFGVRKSLTTAYHPQGDGMVKRFNRTLVQLLRTYVDTQNDWERYLPLVLYAYQPQYIQPQGPRHFVWLESTFIIRLEFNGI